MAPPAVTTSSKYNRAITKRRAHEDCDTLKEHDSKKPKTTKAAPRTSDPDLRVYMDKLETVSDLTSLYATLKLTLDAIKSKEETDHNTSAATLLSKKDQFLLEQSQTALAFLMCKKAIELCTRPKSLGGLAFAQAKADNIVRKLFTSMGVKVCATSTTEQDLVKALPHDDVKDPQQQQDLRKVLPKLKLIGMEASIKVDQVRQELLPTQQEPTKEEQSDDEVSSDIDSDDGVFDTVL